MDFNHIPPNLESDEVGVFKRMHNYYNGKYKPYT